MKKKAEKQKQAEDLRAQLATVSTVILSTFQGITVGEDTKLRRAVQAAGGRWSGRRTGGGEDGVHRGSHGSRREQDQRH